MHLKNKIHFLPLVVPTLGSSIFQEEVLTKSLLHLQQTKHDAETVAAVPADGAPTLFPGGPHTCKGSLRHPAPGSYVRRLKRGGIAGVDREIRPSIKPTCVQNSVKCLSRCCSSSTDDPFQTRTDSRPAAPPTRRKPLPWAAPLTRGLESSHPLTDRPKGTLRFKVFRN